jgi:hypothetical protein
VKRREVDFALDSLGEIYEYLRDFADDTDGRTNEELHLLMLVMAVTALIERDAIHEHKIGRIH